jgi:hypothetical protein
MNNVGADGFEGSGRASGLAAEVAGALSAGFSFGVSSQAKARTETDNNARVRQGIDTVSSC